MKRKDVVNALKKILPLCQAGELRYQALAEHYDDTFLKTYFILYWQKYAQCAAEIEHKIRLHGGELDEENKAPKPEISEAFFAKCPEAERHIMATYQHLLTDSVPVDVRMLLQQHLVLFQDIEKRVQPLKRVFGNNEVTATGFKTIYGLG
jgi:hypothetical protein